MASRVGVAVVLLLAAAVAVVGASARQPPTGTAMYLVRQDERLCPSPRCGGYWVAIANGARTRCQNGHRQPRCYVGRAVGTRRQAVGRIADGALVRGVLDSWSLQDLGSLDELVVSAVYAPAGTATASGGWYRVADNGVRCVRAPCFSYDVTPVNARTRGRASGIDLQASGASAADVARALRAVTSKNGLYARGRFSRTSDGGTEFRALRLYLRAPLPPA